MKRVILRMLFKNSPHALEVVASEAEAKALMAKKQGSDCPPYLAGYDPKQDRHWCVEASQVSSMFTIDMQKLEDEQRRQQQAQQAMMQQQQGYNKQQAPAYPPYHGFYGQGTSGN